MKGVGGGVLILPSELDLSLYRTWVTAADRPGVNAAQQNHQKQSSRNKRRNTFLAGLLYVCVCLCASPSLSLFQGPLNEAENEDRIWESRNNLAIFSSSIYIPLKELLKKFLNYNFFQQKHEKWYKKAQEYRLRNICIYIHLLDISSWYMFLFQIRQCHSLPFLLKTFFPNKSKSA